jgi:hypothetical protein
LLVKKNLRGLRGYGVVGVASLLAVGGGIVASTTASASVSPNNARMALAGTQTGLATAKALQKAAPALPARITADVYLADQNAAGLTAFAKAVSTPGSAQYHHYLTAAQAQAAFAPTAAEAQSVEGWAAGNALQVGAATSGFGAYVQVTGTAGAIAHAFGVKFGSYQVGAKKHAQRFWAPEETASVPASIRGDVLTVTGLDSAKHQATPGETLPPPPQNYFIAPWSSAYYGQKVAAGPYGTVAGTKTKIPTVNGQAQPWTNTGYTPAQVRGAYNVGKSGETGKGVTVAIIDAYTPSTLGSDASEYAQWAAHQPGGNPALDKAFAKGQFKVVQHPGATTYDDTSAADCGASGWYGESTLDVESVHGMAPNANVTYIGASDCTDQGLGNAVAYVVNTHAASIVTDSWGEPFDTSSLVSVYDQLFEAGASEGIGFFFSAGDSGYEDPNYEDPTDQVEVDYPDSSPWVTSVGGTSLAIGKNQNYEGETSWGTFLNPLTVSSKGKSSWTFAATDTRDEVVNGLYDGSSGGGVSTSYAQPWYQKNVVPTKLDHLQHRDDRLRHPHAGLQREPDQGQQPDAGDPGRVGAGRPVDRRRGGRDPVRPGQQEGRARPGEVLPQPDRRHQRRLAHLRGHRGGRPAGGRVPARLRQPGDLLAGRPELERVPQRGRQPGRRHVLRDPVELQRPVQRDPPAGDLPAHAGRGRLHRPQRHLPGGPGGRAWRRFAGAAERDGQPGKQAAGERRLQRRDRRGVTGQLHPGLQGTARALGQPALGAR